MDVLERTQLTEEVSAALARSPAVVIVGPRQVGKTTLARRFVPPGSPNYFDLEDPEVEALFAQPMTLLRNLHGLVVIDEVQRAPEVFKSLRVLLDRQPLPARFLLLGSASPALLRQSSESLAGRVALIETTGLTLEDVGVADQHRLWLRGGYPRALLAADDVTSFDWRRDFMRTLIERDLPQLGFQVSAPAMQRFWAMLAHFHGQVWNAAELARSLGVNESTVRRYLDWLSEVYMVRQLRPWHENLGKRLVKSPKVYLRDSGLLHHALGVRDMATLNRHPRLGASWEGFVVEQLLRVARPDEAHFWATHNGAELDLLLIKDGRRVGVEIKRADAPSATASMKTALKDLKLDWLYVVYPGTRRYPIGERIEVVPLAALLV